MVGQAGNRRGTCPSIQLRERKWQRDQTEGRDFRWGTAYSLIPARKRINVSSRPAPLLPPKPESTATSARPQANALENLNDPPGSSKYLSRPKPRRRCHFQRSCLRAGIQMGARKSGPSDFPIYSCHDLAALSLAIAQKINCASVKFFSGLEQPYLTRSPPKQEK